MLSSTVIVLAYLVAAAIILPAIGLISIGRVPAIFQRHGVGSQGRARIEGLGLLLIGFFILADALAADLGRRSDVPQDWVLLAWTGLAAGLIGIRFLSRQSHSAGDGNRTAR